MNVHEWLDVIGQRNMWRRRRPPVESGQAEVERLLARSPEELHPPVGPAEFRWVESLTSGGVLQEHFTFPSPVPAGDDALDTVHCVRWRRRDRGPDRPDHATPGSVGRVAGRRHALVLVHGAFAGSHRKSLAFVPPVGGSDWDTVAIELPHHMRRQCARSEYSGQFMVTGDLPRLVRGMHQGEADIRALVRGLREMGYERIVAGGLSLGANVLLQAIVRVPRVASGSFDEVTRRGVDGAFLVVPSVDAYASLWESVLGQCLRPAGYAAGLTDGLARRVLRLITPLHMGRPSMPAERLLFVYGLHDLLCPPGPVEELCRAWDGSRSRTLEAGHATLILRCRNVRRIAAAWMKAVTRATPGAVTNKIH